jgi:hypothetical protein
MNDSIQEESEYMEEHNSQINEINIFHACNRNLYQYE